jgi:hypothetical protein
MVLAIVTKETCPKCGDLATLYCRTAMDTPMCRDCLREWHPPFMTLIKFQQGSYNKLWNLEIGDYEEFDKVDHISICDWVVKSRQETNYSHNTRAIVYHMEYNGDVACGRCYGFPFPKDWQECLSQACSKFARPHKPEKQIQYPPERSRYVKWTRNL